MKSHEATALVSMLAATVMYRLTDDERAVWEGYLAPLDADLATKAVMAGRNSWKFFPAWPDFRDAYKAQERLSEPEQYQPSRNPARGPSGPQEVPEWVWVWSWRWHWPKEMRDEDEMKAFPAQVDWTKDPIMTIPEYEMLRDAWMAAGAPRTEIPFHMRRI